MVYGARHTKLDRDVAAPSGFRRLFYDVAPDGRFLMMTDTDTPGPAVLTFMQNWPTVAAAVR